MCERTRGVCYEFPLQKQWGVASSASPANADARTCAQERLCGSVCTRASGLGAHVSVSVPCARACVCVCAARARSPPPLG
eukprot:215744-Pleurochrysis_carterae.AAC.5